jgi:exodeoxyribonuclease III
VRFVALNVQHTGVARADRIAAALHDLAPDVAVLTEVLPGPGAERLVDRLHDGGLAHHHAGLVETHDLPYATVVASRLPLDAVEDPFAGTRFAQAAQQVRIAGITLVALYAPLNRSRPRTRDHDEFWTQVFREHADSLVDRSAIMMGDWNTGARPLDAEGGAVPGMAQFESLLASGWTDAWRSLHPGEREFSWHDPGSGNGFRLDHALLSPALAANLHDAFYVHSTRLDKLSDHSALVVEVDAPGTGAMPVRIAAGVGGARAVRPARGSAESVSHGAHGACMTSSAQRHPRTGRSYDAAIRSST